ncbi:hypothetical protein DFH06DRAFT_568377 [Mycena polygramma]|nr:hypothetical protein DFH06DRAFT_568377 [Mycena polygramma]
MFEYVNPRDILSSDYFDDEPCPEKSESQINGPPAEQCVRRGYTPTFSSSATSLADESEFYAQFWLGAENLEDTPPTPALQDIFLNESSFTSGPDYPVHPLLDQSSMPVHPDVPQIIPMERQTARTARARRSPAKSPAVKTEDDLWSNSPVASTSRAISPPHNNLKRKREMSSDSFEPDGVVRASTRSAKRLKTVERDDFPNIAVPLLERRILPDRKAKMKASTKLKEAEVESAAGGHYDRSQSLSSVDGLYVPEFEESWPAPSSDKRYSKGRSCRRRSRTTRKPKNACETFTQNRKGDLCRCDQCGVTFGRRADFTRHSLRLLPGPTCPLCSKQLSRVDALRRHLLKSPHHISDKRTVDSLVNSAVFE